MNENYEELKYKLQFLNALKESRQAKNEGVYLVDNFTLIEKYLIEQEDIDFFLHQLENEGIIRIIQSQTESDDFVEYTIKIYKLQFKENEFRKLIVSIENRLSGKIVIRYDEPSKTLFINDERITFSSKFLAANQADICKVLLKNKKSVDKKWFNDEVLETWGYSEDDIDKKSLRKIYDAADEVNEKVSALTNKGVENLFVRTLKEVCVNPKYRSHIEF